ncbi:hypothetical protein [Amycolatopsis sp. lyj-23]|uniref:hypothetical protein n=1 Tax=Amycolatopsis sp. lyj-23 TaxID=2789283 RepID=UPI00397E40BC
MSRFVKPALWMFGALAAGGLAFWLLLALDIPYKSTAAPETTPVTTSATTSALPEPVEQAAWVTGVRPGPDDHSAVLEVQVPNCAEAPHARVTEADNRIDAVVSYRAEQDLRCPQTPVDVPIKTTAPIGNRPVVVNGSEAWPVAAGRQQCYLVVGCNPPADHCDRAWIAQVESLAEAEHPGTTRACDQSWLIHDLQRHSGQAPNRVAYRWASYGWASFASAQGGGCAEILAAEPKFPTSLCEKLAPPG